MALIQINGVNLKTPTSYKVGVMDITNAERNAQGTMLIERIAQKRKIEIGYAYLSASDLSTVLTQVQPIFFSVTYLDPVSNTYKTGSFYVGDKTMGLIDFRNNIPRYKDVTFNLIER